MTVDRWGPVIVGVALTLASGFCDALGFLYASRVWEDGRVRWDMLLRSALGFAVGIGLYYVLLRRLDELGVHAAEVQTLAWFGVTLVGVAVMRGEFFRWPWGDQAVGVAVLVGIAWLMVRRPG